MAAGAKNFSRTVVWIIVGLLIVGLAGFGATSFTGSVRTVGKVGNEWISVDDYARELQREMRAVEAQTGQPLTMAEARSLGIDQVVLSRLVQLAALDNEAAELGVSIGDANLQQEIVQIPAFHGINGTFDRETYRFQLDQANIDEAEFEADLRAESARTLVQSAIFAGVQMPAIMTDTLADYVGARRSFTWALLEDSALETPVDEPTEAQLQAYYEANQDRFMLPETRQLTYALLTPEMLLDTIEIDEEAVRRLYDERIGDYAQPERRLVERLVFADDEAAASAKAQLEVGGTTFEALVENRGLALSDIDLGDVTYVDLGEAAETVFAAETGAVVGPLPSDLGPALFRVNGQLAARTTEFDDVEGQLRDELAGDQARRQIDARAEALEDMLAGGATLEELTAESEMELGTLGWTRNSDQGVAAYDAFNRAAAQVTAEDFPSIDFLEDGGIFALRLDEVLPRRPQPFAEARGAVAEAWRQDQVQQALTAQAETLAEGLSDDAAFTEAGLSFRVENGLTRTAYLDGVPADFMTRVFAMEKDEVQVIPAETGVAIVRLNDILPPDQTDEFQTMRDAAAAQFDQALAQALFAAYVRDIRLRSGARLDPQALAAVEANFN
ncbi:peptidyl-prolyl cis-trans isomerase [Pseudooceanicola sp.]|uniref:peptidyl-prolyl cis-trans isomerase n=1 Tax=Pseudooceanicola sp. TaxID=1914328 RepID=UPI003519175A